MALSPSSACANPTTSSYVFSLPLSWSNNCEVAQVLSDIPFISLGILVFGVSALFLLLKRASLSAVCLFFSVLLAFVAAVLDLGHTLADEAAISMALTAIRAREVLFAFSIGFRFLFYWSYVAEPPLKARHTPSTQRVQRFAFLTLERTQELHSGSWMRRGLPGKPLGITLLVAIITITALQMVWRVVSRFRRYSNVYAADSALELLVSVLLLLKLLLNTVALDSPESIVHTFNECLAPICGLLFNIVLGVGDLLYFAFTESTVGRLLQAFELFIIVVFVVAVALLRHRDILLSTASPQGKTCSDVLFILPEPPRESTFRITLPVIETPRMSMVLGTATHNKESSRQVFRRSLNHVSSWVSSRVSRNRPRYEDQTIKLWNPEVKSNPRYAGSIDIQRASIVSSTQEPKEWAELVRDAPTSHMDIASLDPQPSTARSLEGSTSSDRTVRPYGTNVPQTIIPLRARAGPVPASSVSPSPSISSSSKHAGSIAVTSDASPIYGFSGSQSLASASDWRTSLDELLREQSQLDQSIEALKLLSTRTSSNFVVNHKDVELTRSSSIGQRTVSSGVSLSSFPIPPWSTTPVPSLPSPRSLSMMRIREDRRVRLTAAQSSSFQDSHILLPPKTLASLVDIPSSVPHSPLREENYSLTAKTGRSFPFDSVGTRYNVTSFIGGLATPDESLQGIREIPWCQTDTEPSVGIIQTGSGMKTSQNLLPVPPRFEGLPTLPAVAKLPSFSRSARLSQGGVVDEPAGVIQHRIDEQTSRSLTIAVSPQTPVTVRAEKSITIPSTRPLESVRGTGSPVIMSTEGVDRAQKMFVRPRPPPLALQSYGAPQVQVLTDD